MDIGRTRGGKVERHNLDIFRHDILPDVQFGPVADREDPDTFALGLFGIVQIPQFRTLVFGVPPMTGSAEREYALFCATFLLVTPCSAKSYVETVQVQRLLQPFGLPHIGMKWAVIERIDPAFLRFLILMDDQFHAGILCRFFAQRVHILEFPRCIYVKKRERRGRRKEGLLREMQQYCAVLTDAIHHHRFFCLGDHFPHDMDRFGFKSLQMR